MLHANIIAWSDRLDTPGRPWGTTTPVQLWACVKVAPPKHVGFPFWLPSNSQTNLRRVTTLKNKHTHTYVDMSFVALQSANCRSSGICNGSCIQTRTFMIRRLFMGWLRRAWGRQGTLARNHPIPVFRREVGVSFSGGATKWWLSFGVLAKRHTRVGSIPHCLQRVGLEVCVCVCVFLFKREFIATILLTHSTPKREPCLPAFCWDTSRAAWGFVNKALSGASCVGDACGGAI